ncbi:hypothetical protein F4561_004921 [Lipingzhangella halophila]|uniref:DUF4190 domain-containing protein n=1 Tax=Lipingzhangella halophila TaxID=1783352 RepID=A0A7W7RLE4_9ACTN|nr:hypothetical protein [Lipingzhangella halophila]MBB4934101.1 hypothetical protein [Lipingzhangella halophila]
MSQQWPDPRGFWQDQPGAHEWQQGGHHGGGGYQIPPGDYQVPPGDYQSGAWQSQWQTHGAYGYAYPRPGYADPGPMTGSVVAALVVAAITMFLCGGTNIVGLLLACIALGKRDDNPVEAAKLTRYAWISNWIHIGILALIVVFFIVMIVLAVSA